MRAGYADSQGAHAHLSRYPVGSEVSLYIAPDVPALAYLWLPELHMLPFYFVGGAVLLLGSLVGGLSALAVDPTGWLIRFR